MHAQHSQKTLRGSKRFNTGRRSIASTKPLRAHSRRLRCEPLEDRRLLSGTTIIVHGANLPWPALPSWVENMSQAIEERILAQKSPGQPNHVARFEMLVGPSPLNSLVPVVYGLVPGDVALKDSCDGEAIISVNWTMMASLQTTTTSVAKAVADYLLTESGNIGSQLLASPVHLIGHSRGGSLVCALAEDLGEAGVWVDQLTTLDPHPVLATLTGWDWGERGITVPQTVAFADNYWREDDNDPPLFGDYDGQHVTGAYEPNQPLDFGIFEDDDDNNPSDPGYVAEHSDVHLWYHGTVDKTGMVDDGSDETAGGFDPEAVGWYTAPLPGPRESTGFYYSRIGGGERQLRGLSKDLEDSQGNRGQGARASVAPDYAVWPNIVSLNVDSPNHVTKGDPVRVGYWYQDYDSGATTTFYLDPDKNPYNHNEVHAGGESVMQTRTQAWKKRASLSTGDAELGTYSVLARITDLGGHTRYTYAPGTVTLTAVHGVAATAGPHGLVAPTGQIDVPQGGSIGFHATADPGYRPDQWFVNDVEIAARRGFADYRLTNVSGPATVRVTFTSADPNEPNNGYQSATPLGAVQGEKTWQGLGMEITNGDVDYYRFTLASRGTAESFVRIYGMTTGAGSNNLDVALGRVNTSSEFKPVTGDWHDVCSRYEDVDQNSDNDVDQLSLNGFDPGDYFAIVYGSSGLNTAEAFNNDHNPNFAGSETGGYNLCIRGPMVDAYESDNVADANAAIRIDGVAQHHSLPNQDIDWVSFTLSRASNVVIQTDELIGDNGGVLSNLTIALFGPNSSTQLIDDDPHGTGEAEIRREGDGYLAAGTYYVRINSDDANGIADYTIDVTATVALLPEVEVVAISNGDATPGDSDYSNFGIVPEGHPGPTRSYTVRNIGTAALVLGEVTTPPGFILVEGLSGGLEPEAFDTFTVRIDTATVGSKTGNISFTTNDRNANPFQFSIAGAVVPLTEIRATGNGMEIADGDNAPSADDGTDFGTVTQGQTGPSRTFRIYNDGADPLITSDFSCPAGYSVTDSLASSIAPGSYDEFTLQLQTGAPGTYSSAVGFTCNDGDGGGGIESPFTFWITGTVTPPDPGAVVITPTSGLTTTEAGGTATFTVRLDTQPTANVTIGLSSSDTTEGTVSPTSLTFTTSTWSEPQSVTITGEDDTEVDRNVPYTIITAAVSSADLAYNGLNPADVSVTNSDNDRQRPTTCGAYDPVESKFYLKCANSEGFADLEFGFGAPGWKPLSGDWDGDGRDTIGLFQPEAAHFYLRNSNSSGLADVHFGYGDPTQNAQYVLVMGDWNGDGVDTIGLYHMASAAWFLRNTNTEGIADMTVGFGTPGSNWTPMVGDWNGDGLDTIGLYDPATGMFYLRNSHTTGIADIAFPYGSIGSGWTPLIGDWDGNGQESAGFYQPGAASHFYLRNDFTAGLADVHFGLAFAGVQPIVGDWVGPPGFPEITTLGNSMVILDNDTTPSTTDGTDFGSTTQGQTGPSRTFTVRNDGNAPLTLGTVSISNGFVVTKALGSSIAAGSSDTFTVQLTTTNVGTFEDDISFTNNDSDENPFSFRVRGAVTGTLFSATSTYSAGGTESMPIAIADFNGDGKNDIAVANSKSSNIGVLLNNGSGGFSNAVAYAVGGRSGNAMVVRDLNRDDNVDVAIVEPGGNRVSILRGNGNGTFQPVTFATTGNRPIALAAGDFNSDSNVDLAVAAGNNAEILLNDGNGGFPTHTPIATGGTAVYPLEVADFTGDGKIDLVVVNQGSNNITLLLGDGAGGFTALSPFGSGGTDPRSIASADFNGDQKLDIVVGNLGTPGNLALFNGDGAGGFQAGVVLACSGAGEQAIGIGDFDHNGSKDIAVTSWPTNVVLVFLGQGNGQFGPAISSSSGGTGPEYIAVGGLDSAAQDDIVVSNYSNGTVGALLNTVPAALLAAGGLPTSGVAPSIAAAAIQSVVLAAAARWTAVGIAVIPGMVIITDLPGNRLGEAVGNTIYLDRDAAGYGWFVDPTPALDEEFALLGDGGQLRAVDPQAIDRIDLLTVVEHELGHLAGLADLDASLDALMSGALPVGVRRGAGD